MILEEGNTSLAETAEKFIVFLFEVLITAAVTCLASNTQESFRLDNKIYWVVFYKTKHYSK